MMRTRKLSMGFNPPRPCSYRPRQEDHRGARPKPKPRPRASSVKTKVIDFGLQTYVHQIKYGVRLQNMSRAITRSQILNVYQFIGVAHFYSASA